MAKIDSLDKGLVETLQENARLASADSAAQQGVSEATVRCRIDKLLEYDVIQIKLSPTRYLLGGATWSTRLAGRCAALRSTLQYPGRNRSIPQGLGRDQK